MSPDREPQQVVAAPEMAPALPELGLATLPAPSRQRLVLSLQRTVGNAAVARLLGNLTLARQQPPDKPKHTTTTDTGGVFDSSGAQPAISGNVVITELARDKDFVDVTGPKISATATVWIQPNKSMNGTGYVGWIQNLVSTDRGGVYRGPDGELIAEVHETKRNKWDAYKDPDKKGPKGEDVRHESVFAPFYSIPKPISDANTKGNEVAVEMHDEPGFVQAKVYKAGDRRGTLTEIVGSDVFKLALGVLNSATGEITYLKGFDWSIPWAAAVSSSWQGSGGGMQLTPIQAQKLATEGPDPNLAEWSLAAKDEVFRVFSTPEHAAKPPPSVLLRWILPARAHDQLSYNNICAALDAKNPNVDVKLTCDDTGWLQRDVLSAVLRSGSSLGRAIGNIRLDKGQTTTLTASFKDLFGSAAAISAGTSITVKIFRTSVKLIGTDTDGEAEATVPLPFTDAGTLAVDDAKYSFEVSI